MSRFSTSKLPLLLLLLAGSRCSAAIAFVASVGIGSGSTGPTTSASANMTGATLLLACVGSNTPASTTVSDSAANTWNALTMYGTGVTGNGGSAQLFYAYAKGSSSLVTSSSQTFTITSTYAWAVFAGFSGTQTYPSNPFDTGKVNGSSNTGVLANVSTGSITPSADGALIASCFGGYTGGTPYTLTPGTMTQKNPSGIVGGVNYGGSFGYYVQPSKAGINPNWALSSGADSINAGVASFLAPAATSVNTLPLLGVGPH